MSIFFDLIGYPMHGRLLTWVSNVLIANGQSAGTRTTWNAAITVGSGCTLPVPASQ